LAVLGWTMATGQRYLLAGMWSVEITGVYAAAFALGSQPFLAVNTLMQTTLRPVLYDAVARQDEDKERRTLRIWYGSMLGIVVLGVTLMAVLSKPICAVLLGPGYQGAAALLPWIAAAYGVQALQFTSEVILYAHGATKRLSAVQAAGAATSVLLYLALIPRYAAFGAALATLGAFLVSAVLAFVFADGARRLGLRGLRASC
jgi:PST family polysaccharide transporter